MCIQFIKFSGKWFLVGFVFFAVMAWLTVKVGFSFLEFDSRLKMALQGRSTRIYGASESFQAGQHFTKAEIQTVLERSQFKWVNSRDELAVQTSFMDEANSDELFVDLMQAEFIAAGKKHGILESRLKFSKLENGYYEFVEFIDLDNQETVSNHWHSDPPYLASYRLGSFRSQDPVSLSNMPVALRDAVISIEDRNFLVHQGVSFRAILRALYRDIRKGRFAEGGSTITQQLVKNLLLTHKKTIGRKIREAVFALLVELRFSKEQILEAYLNEVYLGQWSTHPIHGVAEGAHYFFGKSLSEISLSQAALLAAMIQIPNVYDPKKNPTKTIVRRNLVLRRMFELDYIEEDEFKQAAGLSLDVVAADSTLEDLDYFLEVVQKEMSETLKANLSLEPHVVYTTLKPWIQIEARRAISVEQARLLKNKTIQKNMKLSGSSPQSVSLVYDVSSCGLLSLQGGTGFKMAPFNRALLSKRQIGSLIKPFVFLAAFLDESQKPPVTPLTSIMDEPFAWQTSQAPWQPKNYDGKFLGALHLREILAQSRNIPTAKLAQQIGIEKIQMLLKELAGVDASLIPSLSLGAVDMTPIEVAKVYLNLARLNSHCAPHAVSEVYDPNRNLVYSVEPAQSSSEQKAAPFYQVVDLMQSVLSEGTARSSKAFGIDGIELFSGKTGTTNDSKDAWFAGFSDKILAVTWVGFDNNTSLGLTGAEAALPIWSRMMKQMAPFYRTQGWQIPSGAIRVDVCLESGRKNSGRCPNHRSEVFKRGQEPPDSCPLH